MPVSQSFTDGPLFTRPAHSPVSTIEEPDVQTLQFLPMGDGTRIAYRLDGAVDKPVLVLSNSIGTTLHMWDSVISPLSQHFRLLRYDTRGHGKSDAPPGAYSADRLGRDVIELVDALEIETFHFLGLSLGGFVGQWLGIHAPSRLDRLVLSNTAAYLGPPSEWDKAIETVLNAQDMSGTAEMFLSNWFPKRMLEMNDPVVDTFRTALLSTNKHGLAGAWAVVRDADMRRTIALIEAPTLVIAGEHDTVTSARSGREMANTIPDARLQILPTVHLPNIEMPSEYAALVTEFLVSC